MKSLQILMALGLMGGAAYVGYSQWERLNAGLIEHARQNLEAPQAGMEAEMQNLAAAMQQSLPSYEGSSVAGSYLSGRFAQRHHDWTTAERYMDYVLEKQPDDVMLLKRAMVLGVGAGDYDRAFEIAEKLMNKEDEDASLTRMFLMAHNFKNKEYQAALDTVKLMPQGGLSSFITPLLSSWAKAAEGQYDVADLTGNSIHLYHAILISDYMGKKQAVENMLAQALSANEISAEDLERIGDIYAHINETENAITLYQQALVFDPDNESLAKKLQMAQAGEKSDIFVRVTTSEQGVAEAFYDMARLLKQDFSDESARVFAHLGLYLNAEHTRAKLLLAEIASRNGRYDEAIQYYKSISPQDEHFLTARRSVATILHELGRSQDAIAELQAVYEEHNDIESLIQIGNIYRIDEDFKDAIKTYTLAEQQLQKPLAPEYWYVYYVRGMSYEQDGQWEKAEIDLKKALEYQPNHPYVLNYLGYAWADQGKNLNQALQMIEKAVKLRPGDGYITDSLGWVYYRMGRFKEAVPYLEEAVELMPYDPTVNDHLGDAYWRVGRILEAKFQWERAKNHSDDEELIQKLSEKLENGLGDAADDMIEGAQDTSTEMSANTAPRDEPARATNAPVQVQ